MPTQTTMSITMDADGRLTLPPELRDALAAEGETRLLAEVIDHSLVLRAAEDDLSDVPEDDRWLYTPENTARILRAMQRPLEEDVQLSEEDVLRLMNQRPE